ncbi:MAG: HepT-like ribonuclease domain-containing protein [Armatimonadota bacterium]
MKPRDPAYLLDILIAARRIREVSVGTTFADMKSDWRIHDLIIREFEVMGEATKRLSEEVRNEYPEIPWHDMAAFRDRLIHKYDTINFDLVWDTVQQDLPMLIEQIALLIPTSEDAG